MNQLPQEAIEAIEKLAQHQGNLFFREGLKLGAAEALLNPSIYSKAGLISLEDALGWVEFYRRTSLHDIATKSSPELFQIYQEQKEK